MGICSLDGSQRHQVVGTENGSRVRARLRRLPFRTCETVAGLTPACLATSRMVALRLVSSTSPSLSSQNVLRTGGTNVAQIGQSMSSLTVAFAGETASARKLQAKAHHTGREIGDVP